MNSADRVQADLQDAPAGARFKPDPRLIQAGWEYRFVASGPRLQEALELYEELGFEVLAEPVPPEAFADECEGCQTVALFQFKTIYTRKPSQNPPPP